MTASLPSTSLPSLPNPDALLETLSHQELLARRAEILSRAKLGASELTDADLVTLVSIIAQLRKRTPSRATSTAPRATRTARSAVAPVEDAALLDF